MKSLMPGISLLTATALFAQINIGPKVMLKKDFEERLKHLRVGNTSLGQRQYFSRLDTITISSGLVHSVQPGVYALRQDNMP
ncbi:MAG: hypothetical protein C4329_10970 [Chitinophagaceae bacterium]